MSITLTSLNHLYGMIHGLYFACTLFSFLASAFFIIERHYSLAKSTFVSAIIFVSLILYTLFFEFSFTIIDPNIKQPAFLESLIMLGKYISPLALILSIYVYKQWFHINDSVAFNKLSRMIYLLSFICFIILFTVENNKTALIVSQVNLVFIIIFFILHTLKETQFADMGRFTMSLLLVFLANTICFIGYIFYSSQHQLSYTIILFNHLIFAIAMFCFNFIMFRHNQQQVHLIKKVKSKTSALLAFDLLKAIKRNEFHLVYQPQICLEEETVHGVEALLRWEHPKHGFIPPDKFILLAEEANMINPISRWVINEAIKQSAKFSALGINLTMSINLSAKDLTPKMASYINKMLKAYSVSTSQLIIEITETALMTSLEQGLKTIKLLTDMGCTISLDDYGTGFSSLSKLRQLSVSELKIDREFITNFQADNDKYVIVTSTIEMGNKLQLRTLAEGVETQSEYDCLKLKKCNLVQGYFIARPMRAKDFIQWTKQTIYKTRELAF